MSQQESTYIIAREDQAVDPVKLVVEGLAIGRAPDCELVLNHPTVSRVHAGIKESEGRYYLFHLSPSNSTTLNGRLVEEKEALAAGDVIQIGPFFLHISYDGDALSLRVVYQTAVRIGDAEVTSEGVPTQPPPTTHTPPQAPARAGTAAVSPHDSVVPREALDVFWQKRKREAGKITRPSPLRPQTPPRLGKARFNWTPTRDLARPWPIAIFTWGLIVIGLLSIVAALSYSTAFSPAPVSSAHARKSLMLTPAIARQPNGNSCTTCHTVKASMNSNCASCHQTDAFSATITPPHAAAGIGCTTCHEEHRGADFRPDLAPISASFQSGVSTDQTCTGCHNDNNKKLYNGRRVFTPHGGTFGYPVTNGHWTWKGLDHEEWEQKPAQVRQALALWPAATEDQKHSAQFHALHLYRVQANGALTGNEAGEMSCSTCHKSFGAALDRETPRTTCAQCHNGSVDSQTQRIVLTASQPNCTSCHVQHVKEVRHWNPSLLTPVQQAAQSNAMPILGNLSARSQ